MIGAAFALALALASSGQPGFQDFVLGQSLSEARAVQLPPSEYGKRQLACTDDSERPSGLQLSGEESSAGLIRCWPAEHIGSSFVRSSLPVSEVTNATVELEFVAGKLVAIETVYDDLHAASIGDALRVKYGKPLREERGEVQNQVGGRFDQAVTTWAVGTATIQLRSPEYTLRRMAVSYTLPEAVAFRTKVRAAAAGRMKL